MRFVLGLGLLCLLAAPAQAQKPCDRVVGFSHTKAVGPITLVPAVPDQRIYFCGFTITQKGNTLDLIIMVGEGKDCETSRVPLTPQLELPNNAALSSRQETVTISSDPGAALCIQTLGNGKLGGMIYYAQF